jgi:hypothetical protein
MAFSRRALAEAQRHLLVLTRKRFVPTSAVSTTNTRGFATTVVGKSKPVDFQQPVDLMNADELEDVALISTETHVKNGALAAFIVAFCFGVAGYSMQAVGQAGSGDAQDPLAGLRLEAEGARDRQAHDSQQTSDATAMLKKFQAGEYDPDKYEEEDELNGKPNRPWYKFW